MNWGTKLVIGLALFMSFIIGMVVYMFSVQDKDSLVDENYYEQGIHFDQQVEALQRVADEQVAPAIQIAENQIILQLKQAADYELRLLRPSSAREDRVRKGKTLGDANLIVVDRRGMGKGLWQLSLSWHSKGKSYLYKKQLTL